MLASKAAGIEEKPQPFMLAAAKVPEHLAAPTVSQIIPDFGSRLFKLTFHSNRKGLAVASGSSELPVAKAQLPVAQLLAAPPVLAPPINHSSTSAPAALHLNAIVILPG